MVIYLLGFDYMLLCGAHPLPECSFCPSQRTGTTCHTSSLSRYWEENSKYSIMRQGRWGRRWEASEKGGKKNLTTTMHPAQSWILYALGTCLGRVNKVSPGRNRGQVCESYMAYNSSMLRSSLCFSSKLGPAGWKLQVAHLGNVIRDGQAPSGSQAWASAQSWFHPVSQFIV